MLYRDILPFMQ